MNPMKFLKLTPLPGGTSWQRTRRLLLTLLILVEIPPLVTCLSLLLEQRTLALGLLRLPGMTPLAAPQVALVALLLLLVLHLTPKK